MEQENQAAWDAERDIARKFLAKSCKPTGDVIHFDDGKDDVFLRLSFAEMVTLLATYGVERMVLVVTNLDTSTPPVGRDPSHRVYPDTTEV